MGKFWNKVVVVYAIIILRSSSWGLRKCMKILNQETMCPGLVSNRELLNRSLEDYPESPTVLMLLF
jgi:hypothetical protein